jgi:hypothetical protein
VQDDHDGVGRCLMVWAIKLSDEKNQEQKYTSALGGRQTTNKNATTNQKYVGSTGERWDTRRDWWGAQGGAGFDHFRAIKLGYSVNS